MFSANASQHERQMQALKAQPLQHKQQNPMQQPSFPPSKPAVELPEVLASLLSKCPPHNYPPGSSCSTPAAGNPKPFSFAKTFGQFYPNPASLGDMAQGGAAGGGNAVGPSVTATDNPIFNSLLALTANAPPTSGLIGSGLPTDNGNGSRQ